jgi:tetratricopeptide (TPR) repeat protein
MNRICIALFVAVSAAAQPAVQKAHEINNQGNRLSESGDCTGAEELYRQAAGMWRGLGPEYEAHLAGTLLNLGVAVSCEGRRADAVKVYEESLALHRRTLGDKNHRTISNMNLLASNYLMVGNFDRARALLEEALPVERELYKSDVQTARTLEGLSNCMIRDRRPQEALAPAEEALAIAIQSTGEESMDTALAYSSVGEAHRSAGNLERALPLYRKARAIYEKNVGPDHPRVASLLSQEGLILMQDGKLSLAEQLMVKAVGLIRTACPGCVVEMAIAQNNLGLLRLKQKRYREADEELSDAIALREKFEARPGLQLAESLQGLALAREKQNRLDDAERLSTRASEIRAYR